MQQACKNMFIACVPSECYIKLKGRYSQFSGVTLYDYRARIQETRILLQEAAEHITLQLQNERSRETYLLDNIECTDAFVAAAISQIRISDLGLREDFKGSVTVLLPTYQVVKKKGKYDDHNLAIASAIEF